MLAGRTGFFLGPEAGRVDAGGQHDQSEDAAEQKRLLRPPAGRAGAASATATAGSGATDGAGAPKDAAPDAGSRVHRDGSVRGRRAERGHGAAEGRKRLAGRERRLDGRRRQRLERRGRRRSEVRKRGRIRGLSGDLDLEIGGRDRRGGRGRRREGRHVGRGGRSAPRGFRRGARERRGRGGRPGERRGRGRARRRPRRGVSLSWARRDSISFVRSAITAPWASTSCSTCFSASTAFSTVSLRRLTTPTRSSSSAIFCLNSVVCACRSSASRLRVSVSSLSSPPRAPSRPS